MKSFVVIFAVLLVVVFADDKYTTKYDNVDIDSIINNDRLLNNYVDCLLDKGNCTPDAQELKNIDSIINNDRLLNNYVDCLLDKGNCTPDAQELKNIDSIINNDRLLNNYVDCLLDKGNCTPDAQELKNIDSIINNDRLLNNYVDCLLDKGNCTPDAQELKSVIGDALATECSKCNDKQKEATKKVIRFLLKNKRDKWNELQAKYDPQNSYVTKYQTELKNEGIVL